MRRTSALVLFVATMTAVVLAGSNPAVASVPAEPPLVRDWATGLCLDSNAGGEVYALGCNGGDYQNWLSRPAAPDSPQPEYDAENMVDVATRRCLDSNAAGDVYTSPCQEANGWQAWVRIWPSDSVRRWRNLVTGRCLDSNAAGEVYTLECNGGGFQDWKRGL